MHLQTIQMVLKLDTLVKQIIRKTAAYEVLEGEYVHCKHEAEE